jgi:hypothetical protein
LVEALKDLKVNQLYYLTEGKGISRTESFLAAKRG